VEIELRDHLLHLLGHSLIAMYNLRFKGFSQTRNLYRDTPAANNHRPLAAIAIAIAF
jgi:hypothetical protein